MIQKFFVPGRNENEGHLLWAETKEEKNVAKLRKYVENSCYSS